MQRPALGYHKPAADSSGGVKLAWTWIKRAVLTFVVLVGVAVIAVWWFGDKNTRGTAATPAALPFLKTPLADLPCNGNLSWHLHRDRITNRYLYAISGTASLEAIESFGSRHGLHGLEYAISSSGTVAKLRYFEDEAPGITTRFDPDDSVYLGGDASLHSVEIYYRVRDGAFTLLISN